MVPVVQGIQTICLIVDATVYQATVEEGPRTRGAAGRPVCKRKELGFHAVQAKVARPRIGKPPMRPSGVPLAYSAMRHIACSLRLLWSASTWSATS